MKAFALILFSQLSQCLVMALFICSCAPNVQNQDDVIPYKIVNIQLDLLDIRYPGIRNDNGTALIDGGVKGIIVYRENAQNYRAFERNSPYQSSKPCAVLTIDPSGFYIKDTCSKSTFDFTGQPVAGPARKPLLQYKTAVNQNILYISN